MEETWEVVEGQTLIDRLKVKNGGEIVEAYGTVKFNEMVLHLGDRTWLLVKRGERGPK